MYWLINYADHTYKKSQQYCTRMAIKFGGFDKVIEFSPENLPKEIIDLCEEWGGGINSQNRKAKRYGLWRPFIIKKTLEQIENGDCLCYCDAGGYFIRNCRPIFKKMQSNSQSVRVSELPLIEKQWTKRDVFVALEADIPSISDTNQICTTFIFIIKNEQSVSLFNKWYDISIQMPILFTDEDNILGKPNYNTFIENRHNQSVFSILCKKEGVYPDTDISEYGLHPKLYSYTKDVVYSPGKPLKEFPYYISHRRAEVNMLVHIGNLLRIVLPAHWFYCILKMVLLVHKIKKSKGIIKY